MTLSVAVSEKLQKQVKAGPCLQKTVQGARAVERKLGATIAPAFVEVAFIVATKPRHCFYRRNG